MNSGNTTLAWSCASCDRETVRALARELDIPPLVAQLLIVRGAATPELGSRFLNPSADHLCDPFELSGVDHAVERLRLARDRHENVLVFGDYDVDGITGTAILYNALKDYGIRSCTYDMPNRLEEGYGINPERVYQARDQNVNLIVTVDNGVTAREAAEAARAAGIDLVITDHHEPEGQLPCAGIIIDPKLDGAGHPCHEICGAAVAFKLATALTGKTSDLDLVALGTVADIVPLRGENRALVALGLREAPARLRPGLIKLAQVARVNLETLTARNVAYQLAPRINAGGRLGDGIAGMDLILADSLETAEPIARELDRANTERRDIETAILEDAHAELRETFNAQQRSIVLARRGWHQGVIGIVASRLQRHFYRPVALVAIDGDGIGHGSIRGIPEFDVSSALTACSEFLVKFGGHRAAGGLTIAEAHIQAFQTAFEYEAARQLDGNELRRSLAVDAIISFTQIDGQLLRYIDLLEPYGHGNAEPVFCTYGAEIVPQSCRLLRGGHLRLALRSDGRQFQAIGFQMGDLYDALRHVPLVDAAFSPQLNTYRGETTIQLVLKDIRPARGAGGASGDAD
ncbi:MAG TPA: single-stranded-DNA-specific exonuclease RecJ [Candidatus Hydrogenedentes bacterium]|nr:single-stranded-DNA-specific exonuclease RecJ [Candidatus Hydrogenedentota bacterium]